MRLHRCEQRARTIEDRVKVPRFADSDRKLAAKQRVLAGKREHRTTAGIGGDPAVSQGRLGLRVRQRVGRAHRAALIRPVLRDERNLGRKVRHERRRQVGDHRGGDRRILQRREEALRLGMFCDCGGRDGAAATSIPGGVALGHLLCHRAARR